MSSAAEAGSREIALLGRVVQSASGNVLIRDWVGSGRRMAISADAGTRKLLGDLAGKKGGEVTIKAKIVEQGGNAVLVLAGEGGGKRK